VAEFVAGTAASLFARLFGSFLDRRRARLLVHRALLLPNGPECFFFNITNLSKGREIELTHVWLDTVPQIPVNNPARRLPVRLRPDQSWETWIEVSMVPPTLHPSVYDVGRARLSTAHVLKSSPNVDVPRSGAVPGDSMG